MNQVGSIPENENKSFYQPMSSEDVRKNIKQYSQIHILQENFDTIFEIVCGAAKRFSKDFEVEYHIVVFNTSIERRFTIMETKQLVSSKKEDDSKANDFGIVGKLFSNNVTSDFLMVQFGYGNVQPRIYINEARGERVPDIKSLSEPAQKQFIGNDSYSWATTGKPASSSNEERKYAIAAMLFPIGENEKGAISIDFVTRDKEYPNFAFRQVEIESIYQMIKNLKILIEILIKHDLHTKLNEIAKIAQGGNVHGRN